MDDVKTFVNTISSYTQSLSNPELEYDKFLQYLDKDEFIILKNFKLSYQIVEFKSPKNEQQKIFNNDNQFFDFSKYIDQINYLNNLTRYLCIVAAPIYSTYSMVDRRLRYIKLYQDKFGVNLKKMIFIYYYAILSKIEKIYIDAMNFYNNDIIINPKTIDKKYEDIYIEFKLEDNIFFGNKQTIMYIIISIINNNLKDGGNIILNINFDNDLLFYNFLAVLTSSFTKVILYDPKKLLQLRLWYTIILIGKKQKIKLDSVIRPSKLYITVDSDINTFYEQIGEFTKKRYQTIIDTIQMRNLFYRTRIIDKNMYMVMRAKLFSKMATD